MSTQFSHVSILGGGLLGGSLALALQQVPSVARVSLWARREETARSARERGIAASTTDLGEAVRDASLLVLAVPVGAMPDLLRQALAAGLPQSCLITDVGSVKAMPHATLAECLKGFAQHFIGSHPMAGSEQGGIEAATASLFQGAACLLTNDAQVAQDRADALETFWRSVGCRTSWLDARSHDALVARISHLPHILAAAAARTCLQNPSEGAWGGGGLRDTTRVAGGHPGMWSEILLENRLALLDPLRKTIGDLQELLQILESGQQDAARQWLVTAKDRRDAYQPPR